jgi:DNA modification methylase
VNKEKPLLNDIREAKAILNNINWDFYLKGVFSPDEMRPFDCRKHHWFPATFIPEIPFTLIEVLTLPDAVVYDPFAGIGTTYFQALLLNRRPLATEICKVAVEYMQSLFVLFNPEIGFDSLRRDIMKLVEGFDSDKEYTSKCPEDVLIDQLRDWYSSRTLNQLSYLFIEEASCREKEIKAAMRISISAILKTASSQDRGWGCIADNVLPKKGDIRNKAALDLFSKHINGLLEDISEHLRCVMPGYHHLYKELSERQTTFREDIMNCKGIPDNSVDLVVTSPPYPEMTDYVASQRLSYYWLGEKVGLSSGCNDMNLEIGARRKRGRKSSLTDYLDDMKEANKVISTKIKRGGYACYVMPVFDTDNENNRDRRRIVQKVLSSMEDYGLAKEGEFERILPEKRRSHNIKWSTLEREKIHLFRKE